MTRAVHIEVVTSLTTEAFLAALRRFIAHRGKPRTIYSDNGTNFQGASNELHEIYNMLHSSSQMARVQDFLTSEGCDWKLNPTTCTALRMIMGSSCQIHEVPSATNIRFSHCHLWGSFHITGRDRGLSKPQTLVCSIRWFLQPDKSVSWTFSN